MWSNEITLRSRMYTEEIKVRKEKKKRRKGATACLEEDSSSTGNSTGGNGNNARVHQGGSRVLRVGLGGRSAAARARARGTSRTGGAGSGGFGKHAAVRVGGGAHDGKVGRVGRALVAVKDEDI